jgi:RNA polymerase sigma-70 factor, ECF subfamily
MSDPKDLTALLALIAQQDRQAFNKLYELTSRHLLGVAYAVVQNRARAEDVLQEAYLNVWRFAPSFNPAVAMPMTWLITITRNKARDLSRSLRNQPLVQLDDHDDEPAQQQLPADGCWHPDELLAKHIDELHVNACMDKLKPGPKQALALAYFRCMAHGEVAASLDVPLGTAKAWIRRGLERLRGCLESSGWSAA